MADLERESLVEGSTEKTDSESIPANMTSCWVLSKVRSMDRRQERCQETEAGSRVES